MSDNPHIDRAHRLAAEIAEQNASAREVIAKALEVLRAPMPDTFLGRKTQAPFRQEDAPSEFEAQRPKLLHQHEHKKDGDDDEPNQRKPEVEDIARHARILG
jgi:hypothetical protein